MAPPSRRPRTSFATACGLLGRVRGVARVLDRDVPHARPRERCGDPAVHPLSLQPRDRSQPVLVERRRGEVADRRVEPPGLAEEQALARARSWPGRRGCGRARSAPHPAGGCPAWAGRAAAGRPAGRSRERRAHTRARWPGSSGRPRPRSGRPAPAPGAPSPTGTRSMRQRPPRRRCPSAAPGPPRRCRGAASRPRTTACGPVFGFCPMRTRRSISPAASCSSGDPVRGLEQVADHLVAVGDHPDPLPGHRQPHDHVGARVRLARARGTLDRQDPAREIRREADGGGERRLPVTDDRPARDVARWRPQQQRPDGAEVRAAGFGARAATGQARRPRPARRCAAGSPPAPSWGSRRWGRARSAAACRRASGRA